LLAGKPGIDQATLAQEAALDTSTTADIAARLELTAAGAKVLAGLEPGIARLQQALLGALSRREQADFMRLLRKFVHINNERSRAPLQRGNA
jgi:MarR family transcriptional regulator, temperature-dependent positive regulator of motility